MIDITYPISKNIPKWPGSIGISITQHLQMPKEAANLTSIEIDCHLGTHLDAPLHFVHQGKSVDQLDINTLIGNAFVAEIRGCKVITIAHLEAVVPEGCQRLLLKTDNQIYWEEKRTEFEEDYSAIDAAAASWLVEKGIKLVGIDYLSIQRFHDGPETHQVLLEAEVVIVETLNLESVTPGWYELICLPIKVMGVEGAPVRAVLRPID